MTQMTPGGGGPWILGLHFSLILVTITSFGIRIYVQLKLVKKSRIIWIAGLGLLVFTTYSCLAVVLVFYGLGQHVNLVPPENLVLIAKFFFTGQLLYLLANVAIKLSISLMLLGIVVEESHKKVIHVSTWSIQACMVLWWFLIAFQCQPVRFYWERFAGSVDGKCLDFEITVVFMYIYTILCILFDLVMVVLPWFVVRNMQQTIRTKVMVAFLLGVGSTPCLVIIARIAFIADLKNVDYTYNYTRFIILSTLETGICIVASNAATFRPLFRKRSSFERGFIRMRALKTTESSSKGFSSTSTAKTGAVRSQLQAIEFRNQEAGTSVR